MAQDGFQTWLKFLFVDLGLINIVLFAVLAIFVGPNIKY